MTVVIYQQAVDSGVIYRVTNRLSGTWHGEDTHQIPSSRWTPEMKAILTKQKLEVNKKPTSTQILLYGWVLIALFIIPALGLSYNEYRSTANSNKKEVLMHKAAHNPQANDLYFGGYGITPEDGSIRTGYAWIKVVDVQGDSLTVQLGTDNGYKEEILSRNYNSSIFDATRYRVGGRLEHGLLQFTSKNNGLTFIFMDSK